MKSAILVSAFLAVAACWGQDSPADRVVVPFSDPSRPKMLKASLLNGSITVSGYDGKEVIVETRGQVGGRRNVPKNADGLRRIDATSYGVNVQEEGNVIRIGASLNSSANLAIRAPFATSLQLRCVNGGFINVDHMEGEIDVDITNGSAKLMNVSGAVVAHALNGEVRVVMDRLQTGKAMSFSSLNGDIDVTLPTDAKARLKMKSENGEVFSDFDIKLEANSKPAVEEGHSDKGKYRVRIDKAMYGTINGGGSDMQFTTVNGRIYIRTKK